MLFFKQSTFPGIMAKKQADGKLHKRLNKNLPLGDIIFCTHLHVENSFETLTPRVAVYHC